MPFDTVSIVSAAEAEGVLFPDFDPPDLGSHALGRHTEDYEVWPNIPSAKQWALGVS